MFKFGGHGTLFGGLSPRKPLGGDGTATYVDMQKSLYLKNRDCAFCYHFSFLKGTRSGHRLFIKCNLWKSH